MPLVFRVFQGAPFPSGLDGPFFAGPVNLFTNAYGFVNLFFRAINAGVGVGFHASIVGLIYGTAQPLISLAVFFVPKLMSSIV